MFDLIAILIPIVLAICIVVAIQIIEDARVRRRLIDSGADESIIRAIFASEQDSRRRRALKWGTLLAATGLGFALMKLFGSDAEDPLSYALVFAAAGLGLLVYRGLDIRGG